MKTYQYLLPLALATLILTNYCVKKRDPATSRTLLQDLCDLEQRRHGEHPSTPIQLYGNAFMDTYLANPSQKKELWSLFQKANNVCRGAYLQLLFHAHPSFLARKWQSSFESFSEADRARTMYLIYSRKALSWESMVLKSLEHDPDDLVREKAAIALSLFADTLDIPTMQRIIRKETQASVLSSLLLSLPIHDDAASLQLIPEFIDSEDLAVGQALISSLATSDLTEKRLFLEQLAHSLNPKIAQSAAAALENLSQKDRLDLKVTGIVPLPQSESTPFNREKQLQLILSIKDGRFTDAEQLLESGASVQFGEHPYTTLIHELAKSAEPAAIHWALNNGCLLETHNVRGETPLMDLAFSYSEDWQERAGWLIQLGADLNATNSIGETALHISARLGRNDVAAFFLEKGANKTLRDHTGRTPEETALLLGNNNLADLLK